jgi:hypothetical protein
MLQDPLERQDASATAMSDDCQHVGSRPSYLEQCDVVFGPFHCISCNGRQGLAVDGFRIKLVCKVLISGLNSPLKVRRLPSPCSLVPTRYRGKKCASHRLAHRICTCASKEIYVLTSIPCTRILVHGLDNLSTQP